MTIETFGFVVAVIIVCFLASLVMSFLIGMWAKR